MATSALINIEGIDFASIYVHYDGYPEHMLPWLEDFNKMFFNRRGDDPSYKFAQLLRFSSKYEEKYNLDKSETTGYGIVKFNGVVGHTYTYTLHRDGKVTYKKEYR